MEYIKRYEADCGMNEEDAIDMAISLNRSNDIQQLIKG